MTMEHAHTIAIATDLLADGRAEDVVQMVEPLLEPTDASPPSTGQLMLRALLARVEIVHRDDPERALDLLPAPSTVQDLCVCVRAEVALWQGWARARRAGAAGEAARALRRLEKAHDLFASIYDARGRCWALLGQAQAYFELDEYALMRHVLDEVAPLVEALDDAQASRWHHELSVPARRFEGRYEAAERHVDALRSMGTKWGDRRIRGYAAAHSAALRYDLGQAPATIIEAAETAETLLRQVDTQAHYPLLAAFCAHVGALLRQGKWEQALEVVNDARRTVPDDPAAQAQLDTLRARVALRQGSLSRAQAALEDILEQASHLPHGLHRSHVALLKGKLLARKNQLEDAQTWIRRAHRNARETGHRGSQLQTLLTLARTAAAQNDFETARAFLEKSREYDDYFSVLPHTVRWFSTKGTIAQIAQDTDEAVEAYRSAVSAASMIGDRYRAASLKLGLAQLEGEEQARTLATEARATFQEIGADDEEEVAQALVNSTTASGAEPVGASVDSPSSSTSNLGTQLARASLSVPLVANACLDAAAQILSDRWMGVYRVSADGIASLVHERGTRPANVAPPSPVEAFKQDASIQWMELYASSPTLALGVETTDGRDAEWEKARRHLQSWLPVIQLAFDRALLHQQPTRSPSSSWSVPVEGFVAESDAMSEVAEQLRRIRTSHSPVLIQGEGGTGKRLLARAVHATSERADGPFEHVACANMQREPIEARLFGKIEEDDTRVPGAVHAADGGTLLIEDVDALSLSAQAALLRLLEIGEAVPVGGTEPIPVDVRVVATTTHDLDDQVRNDHFRPGLRHRLEVISLDLPPLRNRRADIPLLVRHFLDVLRPDSSAVASITDAAMDALLRYHWPGNVRQLRNEIERALLYVNSEPAPTIDRDVLLDAITESAHSAEETSSSTDIEAILHPDQTLSDLLSRTEKSVIERVLEACDGQVTASAEVLGLSRQGLYKKMKRLDIDASSFQPDANPAPASP